MSFMVSVIMSTYNSQEKYLRIAIESILQQSYKDIELLITIDGSTNKDKQIVEEYSSKDNRVIIIDNGSNRGLAYSFNNMIAMSSGKYIFRMDTDDYSHIDRIEKMVDYLEHHQDIAIAGCNARYIYGDRLSHRKTKMYQDNDDIITSLFFINPLIHPTVVFRADVVKGLNLRYTPFVKSEDYMMWVTCAINGVRFANYKKCLFDYRIHQEQITSKNQHQLSESAKSILTQWATYNGINFTEDEITAIVDFNHGVIPKDNGIEILDALYNRILNSNTKWSYSVLYNRFYKNLVRYSIINRKKCVKLYKRSSFYIDNRDRFFRVIGLSMVYIMSRIKLIRPPHR